MSRGSLYLETSALLRWLFNETGAAQVERALSAASLVCTSVLTVMETKRSIQRALAEGKLKRSDASLLHEVLQQLVSSWTLMEISEQVQAEMKRTFEHEPVRTLDAVHLITAYLFNQALSEMKVLTFDERITKNLKALNIRATEIN